MKQTSFLITLFLFQISYAAAQSVSGKIVNEQKAPLAGANIALLNTSDSAVVSTAISSKDGRFVIEPGKEGNYLLKIFATSYKPYFSENLNVTKGTQVLPDITLEKNYTTLKEVNVVAKKPFVEAHADKLVLNVENGIINAGASVLDVLSHAPGVRVDVNDNISLKGKQGVVITIDGRRQPVSAQDMANILRSMPSASVDKIELISNPSARYDAEGVSGIINIKTKKNSRFGLNGAITGNYAQGVYPKTGGGLNLSYRKKRISVFANYNYSYRLGFRDVTFFREFSSAGVFTTAYDQRNYSKVLYNSHTGGTGVDYKLSDKTTVGVLLNTSNYLLSTDGNYLSHVLDSSYTEQSYFTTNNHSKGKYNNYATNFHLQHKFDSTGKELTADMDYARYHNNNRQEFSTYYYLLNGSASQPSYLLQGNITGTTAIRALKMDYTNPLKNEARIDAGIKSSFVTADNEPRFYDVSNGSSVYDSTKSDHFIYDEYINAAYFNYYHELKKWSLQAGVRVEHTLAKGNEMVTGQSFSRSYAQLFPSIDILRHLNTNTDLGVTFSRRISRPSYQDLNPFRFFVDPSTYKVGNPYLLPALAYSAELSHIYKQRFITTFNYSITNNVIVVVVQPSTTQKNVSIQTNQNLAHSHYFGFNGSYTIPVFKWWNSINNFDVFYSSYQGDLSNTRLDKGQPAYDFYTSNNFTLPHNFIAEVSMSYNSAQVYGFLNMKSSWALNAGCQKSFYNKMLTVRMNVTDIFRRNIQRATSQFTDYTQRFSNVQDSRQFVLDITYRFGKKNVSPIRQRKGGAEDEKKRAG